MFVAMGTQWREGGSGLDYGVIEPTLRLMRVARKSWTDIFMCLRVMERAVIDEMVEQRKRESERG